MPDLPAPLPRPRWHLPTMIAVTVLYGILGLISIYFGLLGFMCFDTGVSLPAIIMFSIGWLFPLSFFSGLVLGWCGYGMRSNRLTLMGLALPFVAFSIFCAYVLLALICPNCPLVTATPAPTK